MRSQSQCASSPANRRPGSRSRPLWRAAGLTGPRSANRIVALAWPREDEVVRYRRAAEKLPALAEACESVRHWPPEDPFLVQAYVFGRLLTGDDTVEVVLMLNLPPEEVTWGSNPKGTAWLADTLRLSKGGFTYWWRLGQPCGDQAPQEFPGGTTLSLVIGAGTSSRRQQDCPILPPRRTRTAQAAGSEPVPARNMSSRRASCSWRAGAAWTGRTR